MHWYFVERRWERSPCEVEGRTSRTEAEDDTDVTFDVGREFDLPASNEERLVEVPLMR